MINVDLEKFVIKRSVLFFLLFSIAIIFIFEYNWFIIAGFAIGTILSVSRFFAYAYVFGKIADEWQKPNSKRRSMVRSNIVFLINQLILLPVFYFAYKFNHYIFWGIVAGTLIVSFVIIVNVITEALGITKNQYFV